MEALKLTGDYLTRMNDEEFLEFCAANRDLRIERDDCRNIIVESPTGSYSGKINSEIHFQVMAWNKQAGLGEVFDSSTGFRLATNAIRAADVAWLRKERWEALSPSEQRGFAPVCPDFVIELRSATDYLPRLRRKMEKWLGYGCRLGWLIDPQERKVYIYRPGREVEVQSGFDEPVSGEDVLPGLAVDLSFIES